MFTTLDSIFIGLCLEGFFFGLYSAIFAMYLQYQTSTDKTKNILFYAICLLYVLSFCIAGLDTYAIFAVNRSMIFHIDLVQNTVVGCCDFISQSILIYRCWVVWDCYIYVVIIPSILAFALLALWLAINGSYYHVQGQVTTTDWGNKIALATLVISLTVNALVTWLIVFRILKVYREVKPPANNQNLDATAGSKLRAVIFILIESGMVMFAVQMARLVIATISLTNDSLNMIIGTNLIVGINEMFYGITPTIILVRVSMGLSYHDEKSIQEATASLCFASDKLDSMGSISIVDQESKDEVGTQRLSNDIQIIER